MAARRRSIALVALGVVGVLVALGTVAQAVADGRPLSWVTAVVLVACALACVVQGVRGLRRRG